jgi:hypothetical protein
MSLDVCARCMARVGYRWLRGLSGVWPNAPASLVVETGIAWKALSLAVRIAASRWAGLIPLGARPYASRRECARAESDRSGCRSMRARGSGRL